MKNEIHEECGVFGIYSTVEQPLQNSVYYGLFSLQHRGQEAAGIVVNNDGVFLSYKELGLVHEVFTPSILESLGKGKIAIGHVRYGTTGDNNRSNCQPIDVNHVKGRMALAHNGNIVNAHQLREELELKGSVFSTTSDTETIAHIIVNERLKSSSIEEAVNNSMDKIKGAYSLVIMSSTKLVAARDKHGFRPLCYGKTEDGSYVVASESCALEAVGAKLIRDILPGEILIINEDGVQSITDHVGKASRTMCIFEYIYFARPDSVIETHSVHETRKEAGRLLAKAFPIEADIVIGVPDSGTDAAIGYAEESKIPYSMGFVKNKYIGRTFIAPGQKAREDKVKIKLSPIHSVLNGKRVILIDDSIVRGTTSKKIVKLLKDSGAREVHMVISAPPFIGPCYYGTDIDSKENLIAVQNTIEEICKIIKADSLSFLTVEDMLKITGKNEGFCTACFTEIYPTEIPRGTVKNRFELPLSKSKTRFSKIEDEDIRL